MTSWKNDYIRVNEYSRPGTKLKEVRKIVMHWTANYGASSRNHFKYFDQTIIAAKRYASAHLFVDSVEALCIVPINEVAYHCNDGTYRGVPELKPNGNMLSIGIELCVEKDGSFHPNTIARAEDIAVELCKMYKLDPQKDIVRHYDITHKSCPTPWVRNGQLFVDFKNRVNAKFKGVKAATEDVKTIIADGIKEGDDRKMKLELTASQWDQLASIFNDCAQKGLLSSQEWTVKAKEKSLTVSDAVFLALILDHRRFRDFCNK